MGLCKTSFGASAVRVAGHAVRVAVIGALSLVLSPAAQAAPGDITGRIKIVDGDTLRIGETVIRLHGIDAPEMAQTCIRRADGQPFDCGRWVRDRTRTLYQNARATCTPVDTDRYGRIVARCRVQGEDIAARLVQDGLAFAYRRYSTRYVAQETRAAARNVGLHGAQVQSPAEFRRTGAEAAPTPGTCTIKGNISSNGRIYHLPGQEHYVRTRITAAKGERWFCTEDEARQAGWRRARR